MLLAYLHWSDRQDRRGRGSEGRQPKVPHAPLERLEPRLLLASVPEGFTDLLVAGGINSPTAMAIAADGRIFVAGQEGQLYIVDDGDVSVAMTIPDVRTGGERGFVGITLDPGFSSNGHVYVYYTRNASSTLRHNRLARYTFQGDVPIGGETVLLDLPDTRGSTIHMGGALHFGPDGKLYVAVGDHLQNEEAQQLNSAFGKILRLNPDGSIPGDNPFVDQTSGIFRSIWARGFRNPFTFAFQPGTGRMFINDVGQDFYEEVNDGKRGANYGWPASEGPDNAGGFTAPFYYYQNAGGRCAIAGGVFYNPPNPTFPAEYHGKYFFGDLCFGDIRALDPSDKSVTSFATGISLPVDFDVGPDGALYYLARGNDIGAGQVGRIGFVTGDQAPVIVQHPQDATVEVGASVTFAVVAQGEGSLAYRWQRDGQDLPGATGPSLTLANVNASDVAAYRVIVSNGFGQITSSAAQLRLVSVVTSPTATILAPEAGMRFRGGQTFTFRGSASDPEDGELAASQFSWRVDYHTGNAVRPFVPETRGVTEGTFTIPTDTAYKESDVFYRVRLTVTDSSGRETTVTRDLQPVTSTITLRTNLPGVSLLLDGQPRNPPTTANGVAGIHRLLGAPANVRVGSTNYAFDGWSDGGDREHFIATPVGNATYHARYRPVDVKSTKGLAATYFNNRDRTGMVITANVPTVDFDWGGGSPDPMIHRDTFFVRFRGKVQPEFSETYTFYAAADDGVRLFVNGQLLIDQWNDSNGSELSNTIALQAGQKYDLRFDYFENLGPAKAQLSWSSPSTPKQVIPRRKLFSSVMPQTRVPTADAFVQGGAAALSNFGRDAALLLKQWPEGRYVRETYIKFDIGDVDTAALESAKLRLFGRLGGEAELGITTGVFHAPGAKWSESTINFDNRPEPALSRPLTMATVSTTVAQWWEFDLTEFVREQRELGRTIVTFVLRNLDDSQTYASFASRNALTDLPQLQVFT